MTVFYFWFNAIAYAVFALWCTLKPESTAKFLGFTLNGWKGQAEYVAVYGGIEAGFAAFFLLCALRPAWQMPGLAFATCMYGGLVVFRAIVLVRSGFDIGTAIYPFVFELLMLIAAAILWRRIAA